MEELETKLRVLLKRLQEIPKTDKEKAYLESLIIRLVSANQIIERVSKAYEKLESLDTLLCTGEYLEALKWLDKNPIPHFDNMSGVGGEIPKELLELGRLIVKEVDTENQPTALEVWAFLRGVNLSIKIDNPYKLSELVAIQAVCHSSEVLDGHDPRPI